MVGVDMGGTFTDLIAVDHVSREFRLAKVPSHPADPSVVVMNALDELFANPDGPDPESLGPIVTRQLHAGDVLRLQQGGGVGYGNPFERDPAAVASDVRDRYVSITAAHNAYDVVIDPKIIDVKVAATERLRAAYDPAGALI